MDMKVSIITPCLNSEKTIRDTIESVLAQTYKNIEYIVIDGQSTDGTLDIIKEYDLAFAGRLKYISEKDTGIYDAMNKGILHATGDVIGIINSDDWYEIDAIEEIVKYFKDTDVEVVYGEEWIIDEKRQREYHTNHSITPPHPGMFVKREAYQKYGMYDLNYRIAADWDLILRFIAEGARFGHIDRVVANYSKTGISNTRIRECAEETYEIELKYLGRCPANILSKADIEEKYDRARMVYVSRRNPQKMQEILSGIYNISDGVVIFGAGVCGKELETILRNCNIPVRFFVDNDERKWELEVNGIKIFSPEILRHCSCHVVVTNTRFQEDICRQLRNYANPMLTWSVLEQIRQRVISNCGNLFL